MPALASDEEYRFTPSQDWFSHNIAVWEPLIAELKTRLGRAPRVLEIGSWEGRSATYLLRTLCTTPDSLIVCIDHFDLMGTEAGRARHSRLEHNLAVASGGSGQYRILDDFSVPALMRVLEEEIARPAGGFDLVYVDGSHEADDTLLDAELAWRLAAAGALFVLDDYGWDKEPPASAHHPKRGIDAFLALHAGQYETVYSGYQVILRRTAAPRIGFLCKSVSASVSNAAMGYGMHLALCIDEAYALGAAVAVRSAVSCTPDARITVYIVDCGLSDATWTRLEETCATRDERVTLVRLSLPEDGRGQGDPTWAKVDMLALLPVERALYLDADVLVRHDLAPLWATAMQGRSIGAARDVGHPFGQAVLGDERKAYFNAGVMLLDLACIRMRLGELKSFLAERKPTVYKEQDALNVFFAGDWLELELGWNATGLGTYAKWSSPDRDAVWSNGELAKLHEDPGIVHFTGPLHPKLASVLNEFVQPWISKPWGYGGAPGHPFAEQWWATLEQTAWAGYRQSAEHKNKIDKARAEALENGCQEFSVALGVL